MIAEPDVPTTLTDEGFVQFCGSGDPAKGEYHCSECGYGVTVYRELPVCPMCAGTVWEQTSWSPFGRAQASTPG